MNNYIDVDDDILRNILSGVNLKVTASQGLYSDLYKTQSYIANLYKEIEKTISNFNAIKERLLRYSSIVLSVPDPNPPIQIGKVRLQKSNTLNVRQNAETSSNRISSLNNNSEVTIIGEVDGENVNGNTKWYEVDLGDGKTGYVNSSYVDKEGGNQ